MGGRRRRGRGEARPRGGSHRWNRPGTRGGGDWASTFDAPDLRLDGKASPARSRGEPQRLSGSRNAALRDRPAAVRGKTGCGGSAGKKPPIGWPDVHECSSRRRTAQTCRSGGVPQPPLNWSQCTATIGNPPRPSKIAVRPPFKYPARPFEGALSGPLERARKGCLLAAPRSASRRAAQIRKEDT